jgi:beta-xylosidase
MRRFHFVQALSSLLIFIAACSAPATAPVGSATMAPPATSQPTRLPDTDTPQVGEVFQNPILKHDFPDPFILQDDSAYYAYATNAAGKNISLARSSDLVHWDVLGDALPALPKWANLGGGYTWAPEVIEIGDQYVMYYTARDKASKKQCVGIAISDKPEGKFKDPNDKAFVCQAREGGTIDASPFRDEDGKLYLYYKNDGNCCSMPTYIYGQALAPDGLSLVGEPVQLLRNDERWEGHVIEAPSMVNHDGGYFLFFSANNYGGIEYAVGYARCESPLGPCEDAPENPILASDLTDKSALVIGPGHQDIVEIGDETWIFYHVWQALPGGRRGNQRFMWLDRLDWEDGKPIVEGPTTDPQPAPELP